LAQSKTPNSAASNRNDVDDLHKGSTVGSVRSIFSLNTYGSMQVLCVINSFVYEITKSQRTLESRRVSRSYEDSNSLTKAVKVVHVFQIFKNWNLFTKRNQQICVCVVNSLWLDMF
jgi:hypothetical protein